MRNSLHRVVRIPLSTMTPPMEKRLFSSHERWYRHTALACRASDGSDEELPSIPAKSAGSDQRGP